MLCPSLSQCSLFIDMIYCCFRLIIDMNIDEILYFQKRSDTNSSEYKNRTSFLLYWVKVIRHRHPLVVSDDSNIQLAFMCDVNECCYWPTIQFRWWPVARQSYYIKGNVIHVCCLKKLNCCNCYQTFVCTGSLYSYRFENTRTSCMNVSTPGKLYVLHGWMSLLLVKSMYVMHECLYSW